MYFNKTYELVVIKKIPQGQGTLSLLEVLPGPAVQGDLEGLAGHLLQVLPFHLCYEYLCELEFLYPLFHLEYLELHEDLQNQEILVLQVSPIN